MENGCEWMNFDAALMCLPNFPCVGGGGIHDAAGVNQLPLSGPAADTDLCDRTRDLVCVLRDFRPDNSAQKGKGVWVSKRDECEEALPSATPLQGGFVPASVFRIYTYI